MKERPILFSGAMVRAILAGIKTQTRRAVKLPLGVAGKIVLTSDPYMSDRVKFPAVVVAGTLVPIPCPYGKPGDRIWVRETWNRTNPGGKDGAYFYRATDSNNYPEAIWKPSIHMPRKASRITLEIVSCRAERLNEITDDDARAEGVAEYAKTLPDDITSGMTRVEGYENLWESINGFGSWYENPVVWVVEFKVVKP